MGLVAQVDDAALPPPAMRVGSHYWRINMTPGAGFILVVSDRMPMCHITGGGGVDLQPVVEAVLGADAFTTHWKKIGEEAKVEMITTTFQSREQPAFSILVSRARTPGQRLDRVQVLATAIFNLAK